MTLIVVFVTTLLLSLGPRLLDIPRVILLTVHRLLEGSATLQNLSSSLILDLYYLSSLQ